MNKILARYAAVRIPALLAAVLLLLVALNGQKAHANVCIKLPASPSQATVQKALLECPAGNTVEGVAGVTRVVSTIEIPCGVMLIGPTTAPATMVFTADAENMLLFQQTGGCASAFDSGLSYLHLDGGLALQIDGSSHDNIVFKHNQLTNITALEGAAQNAAINFEQGDGNTIHGADSEYNSFGDSSSCAQINNLDEGGCGIEIFSEASSVSHMVNLVIRHNTFNHLNEAIHFYGSIYVEGNPANTCDNCDIEYNYFEQIHRITIEFQAQTIIHPLIIANNVFADPLNGYYNTYAVSTPCCQYGSTFGSPTISPAYRFENNIEYSNAGQFEWGLEFWGNGTQGTNNLIQGNLCVGFTPGHSTNMSISYNTIQGPVMAGTSCRDYVVGGPGAYIATPENDANPVKTIKGNIKGARPASIQSVAPSIAPGGGLHTFPLSVTLTDTGYTTPTDPFPLGNTGIWYTVDGSRPIPGSGTARYLPSGGKFTLTSAATVKAVGMWGVPPQPASYPATYGFVPSDMVSVSYESAAGPPPPARLVRVSVSSAEHSLVQDARMQIIAACTYSDGATFACNYPDRYGNVVGEWESSTRAVTLDARGVATGVLVGTARITARIADLTSPRWDIDVTPPQLDRMYLTTYADAGIVVAGDSLQFEAHGIYSNGLQYLLPDALGAKISLWNTSNHAIARVSTRGRVTGISPGVVAVTAYVGSLHAPPFRIRIIAKPKDRPSANLLGSVKMATAELPASSDDVAEQTANISSAARAPAMEAETPAYAQPKLPVPEGPGAPQSDSFDGPLWTLEAPVGGSASVSGGHLFVGVPGGANHDALSGRNNAVRVVQPVGDENFIVSIKIDSPLYAIDANTSQGLMVMGHGRNYITYALETDGFGIGLSLHTINNGTETTACKKNDFTQYHNPMYLRLTREGSKYLASYSTDGQDWVEACSFPFTTIPIAVGPFAANSNDLPANTVPVVMSVDSFQTR